MGHVDEKIRRWTVRFMTPFGLCETLSEAVDVVCKANVDPRMSIFPVAVAESDSLTEVWNR